jgi:hypothetical protein
MPLPPNPLFTLGTVMSRPAAVLAGVLIVVWAAGWVPAPAHGKTALCGDDYEGKKMSTMPAVRRPPKGIATTDPVHGTCVVRATDHALEPPVGFARNDYSRRRAFNADNTKLIVFSQDGYWHLYDANSFAYLRSLAGPAGDAEPQWHPSDPQLLYYLPTNGVGMRVMELNVDSGHSRVVGDLAQALKARWPQAHAAWSRSEGSPSADGRYWCFMVDTADWKSVGVVTWDLAGDKIVGWHDTNGVRPDHVSMSPSGNYCVVSGDDAQGTVAFTRDFAQKKKLHHKSEHSDIALNAQGEDVYVSIDYQSNRGDVFMVNLRSGERTPLFDTYLSGSATALHVSGKAYKKPGWVLISTYADSGARQWLHGKIFAVQLAKNPRIVNIALHHSQSAKYWTEPHASVNADFTRIAFSSNWGKLSETDIDTYVVLLPAGALEAAR